MSQPRETPNPDDVILPEHDVRPDRRERTRTPRPLDADEPGRRTSLAEHEHRPHR